MSSHLGFEWQIPNVIVFTVMFILLSYTRRRFNTDVQNCCTCAYSQNICKTVSIYILQNTYRAKPIILHFVKNWLVGTMLIINLSRKLRNLIPFVDLKTARYFFFLLKRFI